MAIDVRELATRPLEPIIADELDIFERTVAEYLDGRVEEDTFRVFRLNHVLLRHPHAQRLPRKFKINFSGCATDCGQAMFNDVGVVATTRTLGARLLGAGFEDGAHLAVDGVAVSQDVVEVYLPEHRAQR